MFIISITMKESKPDWLDVRTWRQVLRAAHKAMGDYWLYECLPQHFDLGKQRKYAYQARSARYDRQKHMVGLHADLVYSGEARDAILLSGYARGYPTRATVIAEAPKHIAYRGKSGTGPNMVNEIERLTEEEKRACAEVLNSTFLRLMGFAQERATANAAAKAGRAAARTEARAGRQATKAAIRGAQRMGREAMRAGRAAGRLQKSRERSFSRSEKARATYGRYQESLWAQTGAY